MGSSPDSDKSLLSRLNALKPSSVSLASSPTPSASHPSTRASVSRIDGLAIRLRLLRQTKADDDATSHAESLSQPETQINAEIETRSAKQQRTNSVTQVFIDSQGGDTVLVEAGAKATEYADSDDPLHFSDERALNAFLQDLVGEYGVNENDDESDDNGDDGFISFPSVPSGNQLESIAGHWEDADEDSGEKIAVDLLRGLGKPQKDHETFQQREQESENSEADGTDDSSRDVIRGAADRLVEQAQDEADWERRQQQKDERQPSSYDNSNLHLPAVPTELTGPTDYVNPADPIAVRLAALELIGSRNPGLSQIDASSMPSVPTFKPADRSPRLQHGRLGYTDEDQRRWCIVCLEDAVVCCVGCDDDPYCVRCWRDMHVGPAASFDEHGHKRVPLEPRRKLQ